MCVNFFKEKLALAVTVAGTVTVAVAVTRLRRGTAQSWKLRGGTAQ